MYKKKKKLLADIFTNNCVLQREKPIRLFGKSRAGAGSTVSIVLERSCENISVNSCVADENIETNNQENKIEKITAEAEVLADGSYEIVLPPMKASTKVTITATDGIDTVVLENVAIGEVWFAGGQSNMEYELVNCIEWEECKATANENVRYFYTPKHDYVDDAYYEDFDNQCWNIASSESEEFKHWSAIGYMFADKLQKKLGCIVGVIGCNWGGTSASAWMSRDAILENKKTACYVEEFEAGDAMKPDIDEQKKIYDDFVIYHDGWNKRCEKLYVTRPGITWAEIEDTLGKCQWPGPMNSYNPFRPYGHYEDMIKQIAPYTLAGFIYYQGESDDHKPECYEILFKSLIKNWRETWKDSTLPFIFTQLPIHKYLADKDFKNWPVIREAQLNVFKTVKNTGMAVTVDQGQFNEIHPKSKRAIAERLGAQALDIVYKISDDVEGFGPIYRNATPIANGVFRVFFDYVFDGFEIREAKYNPEEVDEKIVESTPARFELAGADGVYKTAAYVGQGLDYVDLKCEDIAMPVSARYLWTNYGKPILFGGNGIPASPFVTK